MGVFKSIEEVPTRYRLEQYSTTFQGQDTWNEYLEKSYLERYPNLSEQRRETVDRAGRRWKEFMQERGRHHALATPADVEAWAEQLLDRVTVKTAYGQYWTHVEGFYSWLQNSTNYPHVYHPVWMAVASYQNSREIWNFKLSRGNRNGGTWNE
jgi:sarcosine oxidase delta subunit